jgi:hypothetical protein
VETFKQKLTNQLKPNVSAFKIAPAFYTRPPTAVGARALQSAIIHFGSKFHPHIFQKMQVMLVTGDKLSMVLEKGTKLNVSEVTWGAVLYHVDIVE